MIEEKIWRALLAAGKVRKSWLQPVRTYLAAGGHSRELLS